MAVVKGINSQTVIDILKNIDSKKRDLVSKVTLDMAGSMNKIVKKCFPKATLVIDKFHVQKLAYDAKYKKFAYRIAETL